MGPRRQKLILISAILSFHLATFGAPQPKQVVTGHVRAAVAEGRAKPVGQMPADGRMNLAIILPLRNQDQLQSLLARLYDSSDPKYRKFLSVAEFTDQFGPTDADYRSVVQFVEANGMIVTGRPANRLIVPVTATVDQVQKTFNVQMKVYQHPTENRTFFSPDREPALPEGVSIAHIAGLNNFSLPRPMHVKPAGSEVSSPASVQGSGPGASYLGVDMRAAYYGGTELTGSGQIVGLLQFDGYDPNDVDLTFTNSGLINAVPIHNVLLDGATGAQCQFMSFPCEDAEQVLDIVQAAEMAPGLAEVRVYIGSLDADILNAMASENVAKQLSVSWTWTPDDPVTDDVFFQEFAAQGQSIFVASGDDGAFSPNISDYFYPAEDAFVTAVGGTSLVTTGAQGQWVSETAWNHSGGGISPDSLPIPNWQTGVANASNGASTTFRNIPDVAMEADFDNYACNAGARQGGWGGTSFAAPRWAGFAALINQQAAESGDNPIGFLNPALYGIAQSPSYTTTFHDITSGQNDNGGAEPVPDQIFAAVLGYDLVTGWGSPTGQDLIDALAPKAPSGFQLSSSIAQLAIAPGNSGSVTITIRPNTGFTGSVSFAVKGLPDGVETTWSANPAATSSQLTLQVSDSATRGSYLVTVTGTSGPVSVSTTIALVVDAPGFSILPSRTELDVRPGLSSGTIISVTRYAGFMGPVTLAITTPLPSGVTADWSGNPAQDHSQLTLSATSSAPLATTILTITATSGSMTAMTTVSLGVGRPGFWLNLAPSPSSIVPGGQVTSMVTMLPIGTFNEPAILSASQLPSGITATFSPTTISPGQSSVMTLSAASNMAAGNYSSTATGSAADSAGMWTFQYSVTATPVQSFGFVASPALVSIQQGQSNVVIVTATAINGFNGSIEMFGIPQIPVGMTYSFTPPVVSAGGSTQLTLTAGSDTLPGNYAVGVGGQSGMLATGTPLFITVTPASSLSIGLSPSSLQLPQGQSATATATVTSTGSSVENPAFAVVSVLPEGLNVTFNAGQDPDTGVITLTASSSIPAGTYTLNIAASSGTDTVDVPMTVTVTKSASSFSVAASAATVNRGSSAQSTITLSSTNGYSGSIALSCSVTSSPAGAQDPPTCTAGPSVTLSSQSNSVQTSVTVSTTAATTSGLTLPLQPESRSPWAHAGGGLGLAGLIFLAAKTRRKFRSMVALLLLSGAVGGFMLCGCGGAGSSPVSAPPTNSNPGTTTGKYTITVSGKGNDVQNTTASATFTLTVQ